jgi:arginine/lysine/ornithine decarboxylase
VLTGLNPVFVPSRQATPTTEEVLAFLSEEEKPGALLLTHPSYRGELLDLPTISRACRTRGIDLIVDEVHGTHFRWTPGTPTSALDLPCELALHSLHKYAGALVQCAILHVPQESRFSIEEVELALDLVDTTSRSNLLQISLEATVTAMNPGGSDEPGLAEPFAACQGLAQKLDSWPDTTLRRGAGARDPWKLPLTSDRVSGYELARRLLAHGIDHEYANVDEVLLILSPCHTAADYLRVEAALAALRNELLDAPQRPQVPWLLCQTPEFVVSPRDAWFSERRSTARLAEAMGAISASLLAAEPSLTSDSAGSASVAERPDARIPPGVPVLFPGERVTPWHLNVLLATTEIAIIPRSPMKSSIGSP